MNGHAHRVVGDAVGGGVYLVGCRLFGREPTLGGFVVAVGGGLIVSSLHDVFEPAIHPNHRAFIHSVAANGCLAATLRRWWQSTQVPPEMNVVVTALGLAWLSHPLLDALSPKRLPLVGDLLAPTE